MTHLVDESAAKSAPKRFLSFLCLVLALSVPFAPANLLFAQESKGSKEPGPGEPQANAAAEVREISFRSEDGWEIKGTLHRVGVVGATLGAKLAGLATVGDRRVKALILISGYGDETVKKFVAESPDLAVFCVASKGDSGPVQSMIEIHRVSKNPESQMIVYGGAERSSQIFQAEPELEPRLAEWFKDTLAPDPPAHP